MSSTLSHVSPVPTAVALSDSAEGTDSIAEVSISPATPGDVASYQGLYHACMQRVEIFLAPYQGAETEAILNLMQQLWQRALAADWPHTRQSQWRYAARRLQPYATAAHKSHSTVLTPWVIQAKLIQLQPAQSAASCVKQMDLAEKIDAAPHSAEQALLEAGCYVGCVQDALQHSYYAGRVLAHWRNALQRLLADTAESSGQHVLALLSAITWQQSLVVILDDSVELTPLLHIRLQHMHASHAAALILVIAGEKSQASVLLEHTAAAGLGAETEPAVAAGKNADFPQLWCCDITCAAEAVLDFYSLQHLPVAFAVTLWGQLRLEHKAQCNHAGTIAGAAFWREAWHYDLCSEHAAIRLSHVLATQIAAQYHELQTHVCHAAANTHSDQLVRGSAASKACIAHQSAVQVHAHASDVAAEQDSAFILLAPGAEVCTQPVLEINHDQVRCTHGATVGELNQQALFYLQSRGLSRSEAQDLLQHAFVSEALDRWSSDRVAQYAQRQLDAQLTGGQHAE